MDQSDAQQMARDWGAALRARRKALRVSMVAAAAAAGMSRVTWHRLESGDTGVAWRFVLAASQALGLGLHWGAETSDAADESATSPLGHGWLPLTISLDQFAGLRSLAWQVADGSPTLSPRQAWELYDRAGRHLQTGQLSAAEKALMAALRSVYGGMQ